MADDNDLVRLLVIVVALVLLVPLLMMVVAWPMMGMWGGGHMWSGSHIWDSGMWDGSGATWIWFGMWVVMLLILLGGGYLLYRGFERSESVGTDTALEELRIAYAQGELTDDEFEERRTRLRRRE